MKKKKKIMKLKKKMKKKMIIKMKIKEKNNKKKKTEEISSFDSKCSICLRNAKIKKNNSTIIPKINE